MGPPLLTSSPYCKRTGHYGRGTKHMEDERCSTTLNRAPLTSGSNTAGYNTAECKLSRWAKGHRVGSPCGLSFRGPSFVGGTGGGALVATSGTASHHPSHLIDTGHHTDRRAATVMPGVVVVSKNVWCGWRIVPRLRLKLRRGCPRHVDTSKATTRANAQNVQDL